jgi:predicted metalloenzyme YecM
MQTLTDVIGDYDTFLAATIDKVVAAGFDLKDFSQLDHLCYRTISTENYEAKKQQMIEFGTLLTETIVNGRPIAVFRLKQPLYSGPWRVDVLELPAPKAGAAKPEGLEHIELVLFDDIATFLQKYADKTFNMVAADRGINPEIAYDLGDRAVKFHLLSLGTVTYIEDKLGITEVANN